MRHPQDLERDKILDELTKIYKDIESIMEDMNYGQYHEAAFRLGKTHSRAVHAANSISKYFEEIPEDGGIPH